MVSPLPTIVTLAQAKKAAQITTFDGDEDLYLRLEIAHELCLDYLNNRIDDSSDEWIDTILSWTTDNAPKRVKGAILHTFVHLQRFRGDDSEKDGQKLDNGLPPLVRAMLDRMRDPTVA
jgi:hypothetical protein